MGQGRRGRGGVLRLCWLFMQRGFGEARLRWRRMQKGPFGESDGPLLKTALLPSLLARCEGYFSNQCVVLLTGEIRNGPLLPHGLKLPIYVRSSGFNVRLNLLFLTHERPPFKSALSIIYSANQST